MQTAVFTYHGTERVMRYAFDYARQHGRKKVTSATKSNAINYSMVFWDDVFRAVSASVSRCSARTAVDRFPLCAFCHHA